VSGSNDNLVAVSPKSGRAVSAAEAEPYADRLLPLPPFMQSGGQATWSEILQGLGLTGHFLVRDVLTDRAKPVIEGRLRLVDRLRRASGLA
jgi:DNA repair protein RecO (recombination protein O)